MALKRGLESEPPTWLKRRTQSAFQWPNALRSSMGRERFCSPFTQWYLAVDVALTCLSQQVTHEHNECSLRDHFLVGWKEGPFVLAPLHDSHISRTSVKQTRVNLGCKDSLLHSSALSGRAIAKAVRCTTPLCALWLLLFIFCSFSHTFWPIYFLSPAFCSCIFVRLIAPAGPGLNWGEIWQEFHRQKIKVSPVPLHNLAALLKINKILSVLQDLYES